MISAVILMAVSAPPSVKVQDVTVTLAAVARRAALDDDWDWFDPDGRPAAAPKLGKPLRPSGPFELYYHFTVSAPDDVRYWIYPTSEGPNRFYQPSSDRDDPTVTGMFCPLPEEGNTVEFGITTVGGPWETIAEVMIIPRRHPQRTSDLRFDRMVHAVGPFSDDRGRTTYVVTHGVDQVSMRAIATTDDGTEHPAEQSSTQAFEHGGYIDCRFPTEMTGTVRSIRLEVRDHLHTPFDRPLPIP